MRKRVIALFLAVLLSFGMIPHAVLAADNTVVELEDEYINLGEKKSYTVDPAVKAPEGAIVNTVKINSNEVIEDARTISKAGDYAVELVCDSVTYQYDVICYRRGDANIDESRDIRDLVATYRTENHTKESENYGADINGDGSVDNSDYLQVRQLLVGKIKSVMLFDFEGYTGSSENPSAYSTVAVSKGKTYTFSFNYYMDGESSKTTVINAAKNWQSKSAIEFDSTPLQSGKGTYSFSFTADYVQVIPVIQSNVNGGQPKLYVWDMTLIEEGTDTNLLGEPTLSKFSGEMVKADMVSIFDIDPDTIEPSGDTGSSENIKSIWLFDFAGYTGDKADLNAYCAVDVEKDVEYTFSFEYCVIGNTTGTNVGNAAQLWLGANGSKVEFLNNKLTGEGTYTFTFTADYAQIIPVFQTYTPYGAPELYVWDMKLVKTGSEENLLAGKTIDDFKGVLKDHNLISIHEMSPDALVDKPVNYNTAILYNEQNSSYDENAEAKRQTILDITDTVQPSATGTAYYVSYNGNDSNDGMTPETAWRSAERVTQSAEDLASGDVVLFERGGVYRGNITLTSGVSYGAYGEGSKPCIYGSPQNYAWPSLWQSTDMENVWAINVGDMSDIGNIVFAHGKKCGFKMQNGSLTKDFEFYHDTENGMLYLYLSFGNPGSVYSDIELCGRKHIMYGAKDTTDVLIENLCLKYSGAHGIAFSTGSKNITVQGCEIGYIGGSMLAGYDVRYGNGVEFVDNCDGINVNSNWIYQCYDAGVTHQSSNTNGCQQKNIIISENLIEYCSYNIEYYVDQNNGKISDTVYENNILRFAGYGFGSVNRIGSDNSVDSNICCYVRSMSSGNFVIQNNVLDSPKRFQTTIGYPNDTTSNRGPVIKENTYIQQGTEVAKILVDDVVTTLSANSLETLAECIVTYIDSAPKSVIYEN